MFAVIMTWCDRIGVRRLFWFKLVAFVRNKSCNVYKAVFWTYAVHMAIGRCNTSRFHDTFSTLTASLACGDERESGCPFSEEHSYLCSIYAQNKRDIEQGNVAMRDTTVGIRVSSQESWLTVSTPFQRQHAGSARLMYSVRRRAGLKQRIYTRGNFAQREDVVVGKRLDVSEKDFHVVSASLRSPRINNTKRACVGATRSATTAHRTLAQDTSHNRDGATHPDPTGLVATTSGRRHLSLATLCALVFMEVLRAKRAERVVRKSEGRKAQVLCAARLCSGRDDAWG
jgi:hypothetical protein